ncbi:MAG: 3-hydroxyacyl-CoA dehydrogenase/enoyl-CoA hydratase family protein [Deltaproteobacteria bacterium]|nr:3-hydroxyacyl-CoA dehydrogenase/enoyl-CoA hydratase family protein [Deltaproteobacteria bacterium]
MPRRIRRAAVLGSGVMGSGIAAHLAGMGVETLLLDILPPEPTPEELARGIGRADPRHRNRFAIANLQRTLHARPPLFFDPDDAALVTPGNFEDHLHSLARCDWVVEAVTENLEIKRKLFARVDAVRGERTIVTSNTSGLKIAEMVAGRSESFVRHFFVTHFFNPVRYMRLLELVAGEGTDRPVFDAFARFGSDVLGKGIVYGKDTPNFVANRIGTYGMLYTLHAMVREGFSVEEIDALFGPVSGRPKSAIFRTADLVGLDTLVHVANNCYENLPGDEEREVFRLPDFLREMVQRGWLGQKTKGGFYKKEGDQILALDLRTMEYRPQQKVRADSIGAARGIEQPGPRIRALVHGQDRLARLAWEVTARVAAYSARRLGEIADDVVNIDNAMRWGFAWELGPFETWDAIGVQESLSRMSDEGIAVPDVVPRMLERGATGFYGGTAGRPTFFDLSRESYRDVPEDPRAVRLPALADAQQVVKQNAGSTLYDLGDGVLLLAFHTKMNAVDSDVIAMLDQSVALAEEEGWTGLVLGNDHKEAFSAGANLFAVLMAIQQGAWGELEKMISSFQHATLRLRYSDVPVVAAPAGLALGGGAEMVMGADAVRAHAELYMGLVEFGVGLIPGGGGTLAMLERCLANVPDDPGFDVMPFVRRAFEVIGMAKVSVGAEEARRLGLLRPTDGVTLNRDLLLHDAKQTVLGLARAGYRRPRPLKLRLPGPSGAATIRWFADNMRQGKQITDHEYLMASKLGWVLCGGETSPRVKVSQQQILDLEREAFLSLCGEKKSQERMQHMLQHGKPLRN